MGNQKTEAVIKINNGQDVPFTAQQIMSITISKEVNKIPTALISIKDGKVHEQDFPISNQDFFKPGVPIQIFIGGPQSKAMAFEGIITQHNLKIKKDKPSLLLVECKDEAVRLTIGRKSRYWNDASDSDIFEEIVGEYDQLEVEAEGSNDIVIHGQLIQYYSTDWDFIAMRSEAIGQYIFANDGKLSINKPKLSEPAVVTLEHGLPADTKEKSRIWEFESEMDARYQFSDVNTLGWDYAKQEVAEGNNAFSIQEAGDIPSSELAEVISLEAFQLHSQARMDESELTAFANAVKQKSVLNKSRGRIKIDGRADIKPGDMVTLSGVGNRFNGNVFVARVFHTFEPGRWFTHIQFGLPYCWFHQEHHIPNPPAQGLLPSVKGLQIGKVIQLRDEENPDRNFRIKVSIPGLHKKNEGVWARLSSFHAGNERGAVFLPELEDEVIVGYIGQDSREPIVLGSLYSESNPPPLENSDDNFNKGFFTRNQHKIQFDDKNNVITIETQGKQKVVLDDSNGKIELADSNQNSVKLDASGISLKSSSNISLEAPKGKISLKGANVSVTGNTGVDVNYLQGGPVKMGNGVKPAASLGDPAPPIPGAISATANVKVLI